MAKGRDMHDKSEAIEKTRIGVFGMGRGCGTSFIAGTLAHYLSVKEKDLSVSLGELGTPYFYRALSFEKRELLYPFFSYEDALKARSPLSSNANELRGINWLIKKPESSPEPPGASGLYRFISRAPGDIVVFDCSGIAGDKALDIAAEMDAVYFVLDPLPTRLLYAMPWISRFLLEEPGAHAVVNKNNSGVHLGELRRFLGRRTHISVGYMPPELIYKAE